MTLKKTKKNPTRDSSEEVVEQNFLTLHNDDVHTFDYVIDALVKICDHGYEQATQCTMLIHYKGKCDVKKGGFKDLKPMKDALLERELNATIE
jgi:ATP-dependent Clp protease adaptor protein ClpS